MFRFSVTTQAGCRRSFLRHLLHNLTTLPILLTTAVLPQAFVIDALAAGVC